MSISPCFKKNVSGQHSFQECITEFPGGLAGVLQEYQRNCKENRKAIPLKTSKFLFLFFNIIHVCSKQFKLYRKVKFLFLSCYCMYLKIFSAFTKIRFHFHQYMIPPMFHTGGIMHFVLQLAFFTKHFLNLSRF